VVVDIKQHKSQFKNSNFTIAQSAKFFWHCVMVMFGFPRTRTSKKSRPVPSKKTLFCCYAIGFYSVKTVADRYRFAAISYQALVVGFFTFINFDDIERPWTPKRGVLLNFSQFLAAVHISTVNCDEMAGDRPRQPAYEIFTMECRF